MGLDFMGGAGEGAAMGASTVAGLQAAGMATGPYGWALVGGLAAAKGIGNVAAGIQDQPAREQAMRLGDRNVELQGLAIKEEKRRQLEEKKAAMRRQRLAARLGGILSKYKELAGNSLPLAVA